MNFIFNSTNRKLELFSFCFLISILCNVLYQYLNCREFYNYSKTIVSEIIMHRQYLQKLFFLINLKWLYVGNNAFYRKKKNGVSFEYCLKNRDFLKQNDVSWSECCPWSISFVTFYENSKLNKVITNYVNFDTKKIVQSRGTDFRIFKNTFFVWKADKIVWKLIWTKRVFFGHRNAPHKYTWSPFPVFMENCSKVIDKMPNTTMSNP